MSEAGPPGGWPTPRAAYIHVPFCRHRCGYCNFSVVAGRDDLVDRYLAAIDAELAALHHPTVDTIFLGGGTPSHLSPSQLERLLDCVSSRLGFDSGLEWTIEANPEDIDDEILALLTDRGVNRISLGVQSFDDKKLQTLERGHSGDLAAAVIDQVSRSIANVSIDLIFAAPGETLDGWHRDLATALSLPIRHLSAYTLTYEKGTSFWSRRRRKQLQPAAESLEVEMYLLTGDLAVAAGLSHYEISNHAFPDWRCRHNVAYWEGRGWYAAGPGAARFVAGCREVNHRSTTTYLRRIESGQCPAAESELVSLEQYARERAAFGIRMIDGIDLDALSDETGVDLRRHCGDAIRKGLDHDLLLESGNRVKLTERGILFADSVASDLLG